MKPAPFYILPAILLLAMIACSDPDEPIIDEALLDISWQVDSLQTPDTSLVMDPSGFMTIQFTAYQRSQIHTGCRPHEGKYRIREAGHIAIYDIIGTDWDMYCGDHIEFLEGTFVHILKNIMSYEVGDNRLALYDSTYQYMLIFKTQ